MNPRIRPPQTFETPRLRLRPPQKDDAAVIFSEYARDPEVTRFLLWRPHKSVRETKLFLTRCTTAWQRCSAFPWAITEKASGRLVGMVEVRIDGHKADIGYVLSKAYWGRGYMPEAAAAIIEWALQQPALYRIWAVCDTENRASARVLEKVGMKKEGVLQRWIIHPNLSEEPRDCYCYAIAK
ncbi:MAG TPA: GNAT family N-acetyltransferase [Acidobacteriota bacterium]|jgi:RimJ/RimL family protein N-acetyltransferase